MLASPAKDKRPIMDVLQRRLHEERNNVQRPDNERIIETHVMMSVLIERMGDMEEKVGAVHKRLYENGLIHEVKINTMFRKWSLRSIGAAAFISLAAWLQYQFNVIH